MSNSHASSSNQKTFDLGRTVKDAVISALIMFGLSVPILALRAEQNMENRLILEPR